MSEARCLVCDSTDKWESVDKYRKSDKGMKICTNCGFVSYPDRFKEEQDAKDYYHKDYRRPPNIGNLNTGNRKLHMHAHFLRDLFKEWKDASKEEPVVCDIGAAYGIYLNFIKSNFPKAKLLGTEFTLAYRRNAWHEYGIELGVDFDKGIKYDLISSYKVAEHQVDADLRLREYVEALKDDGYMYVSVPTWFDSMSNPGNDEWDLEYYYHPDHINVWTRKLFETVLKKVGLEVVKYDGVMYGDTYLCKRNDELMKEKPEYEDPKKIIDIMEKIQEANDLYENQKFGEALRAFDKFPKAWILRYEQERAAAHKQQGDPPWDFVKNQYIEPAIKVCGNDLQIVRFAADACMRYNKFKDAIDFLNHGLELRPNNGVYLMMLGHCLRQLSTRTSDTKDKLKLLLEARDCTRYMRTIDLSLRDEGLNWIYNDNANLPTPSELKQ